MRTLRRLTVGLLVMGLSVIAAGPASAQLADPSSLASSGVLLPFFSDPAAGHVSIFEITSPIANHVIGFTGFFSLTNPLHMVFFRENCTRSTSASDVETAKQAKALISNSVALNLTFNGLAAVANTLQGNDLVPPNFPLHTRTHWIDTKTGRLRELEPIILNTFLGLDADFVPLVSNIGAGASVGLCAPGIGPFAGSPSNGFCWSPLRSAATFVTPQESASLKASIYLICPTADIQNAAGTGVFPVAAGFPRLVNRDATFGFPARNVFTGANVTTLRGRIYDDDEDLVRDIQVPCTCLSTTAVLSIDSVYGLPPTNLGAHTVPVWYTELEVQSGTSNPLLPNPQQFSFTGYWGLEVAGREATLFHRMSTASLDNLSFGTFNLHGNR